MSATTIASPTMGHPLKGVLLVSLAVLPSRWQMSPPSIWHALSGRRRCRGPLRRQSRPACGDPLATDGRAAVGDEPDRPGAVARALPRTRLADHGVALRVMPVGENAGHRLSLALPGADAVGTAVGERVGMAGWLGAVAGFAGVLLILPPGCGARSCRHRAGAGECRFATAYHILPGCSPGRRDDPVALSRGVGGHGVLCHRRAALARRSGAAACRSRLMVLLGILATLVTFSSPPPIARRPRRCWRRSITSISSGAAGLVAGLRPCAGCCQSWRHGTGHACRRRRCHSGQCRKGRPACLKAPIRRCQGRREKDWYSRLAGGSGEVHPRRVERSRIVTSMSR